MPASRAFFRFKLVTVTAYAVYSGLLAALCVGTVGWTRQLYQQLALTGHMGTLPTALMLLWLALCGSVLVHEGGHWLGSQLAGFRCLAIVVLWLRLERQTTGWRLRLGARPAKRGGYVQALAADFTNFRRRQLLFIAAGPAANLLVGAVALGLGWQLQSARLLTSGASITTFLLVQGLMGFGGYSLFTGLGNLLPLTYRTDGSQLLTVLRGGPAWERKLALHRLISASHLHQQRPRDWHPADLTRLLAYTNQSGDDCTAHLLAYAHALDQQDTAAACHHLQQAIDRQHLVDRPTARALYAEAAYCEAIITQKSRNAQHWLRRVAELAPLTEKDAFTEAVVAYSNQDYGRARQLLQRCQTQLDALPTSGLRAQGQERLDTVHALLAQQFTVTPHHK